MPTQMNNAMGSLPNLHELGKEHQYRPGPALGHLCGDANPALSQAEKSRILHRYSGHARITKARSNGHDPNKIVYDDFMLEHMAAYSPISTRSNHMHTIRRRESMSSSIGATSVRRLIAVVRNTPALPQRNAPPPHTRRLLLTNVLVLCLTHLCNTAAYLPFLALQGSVSIWTPRPRHLTTLSITVGSLLLALVHFFAAGSALLGPILVRRLGSNVVLFIAYLTFFAFYLGLLYPLFYVLVPLAVLLGLVLGPLISAQVEFLMTLSVKITQLLVGVEDVGGSDEDIKTQRRTCIIRRLARAFQAAHDFGLILGSVLSALVISYTVNITNQEYYGEMMAGNATECRNLSESSAANCSSLLNQQNSPNFYSLQDYNTFLDGIFDTFEDSRLCGAQACPPTINSSNAADFFPILPPKTSNALAVVYGVMALVAAVACAGGLDRIRVLVQQDPLERSEGMAALRAVREAFSDSRLRLAAPMALFIGMEQAFMYADFSKSYVVCTLGIHRLNLVFLCMGLLQSIAACTLSMLLRTIRRYYVVLVGFTFHGCLLMVLILWKPIEDDPALFYVISAAWGVCNAIWEMLNFTLLTGLYCDSWAAPFAHSTFYRFVGMTIAFGFHGLLCNYCKLYALCIFLLAAVVPFAWLEVKVENQRKVKNISRL